MLTAMVRKTKIPEPEHFIHFVVLRVFIFIVHVCLPQMA